MAGGGGDGPVEVDGIGVLRAGVGGVDEAILGGVAVAVVRQDNLAGRGGPVPPSAVLFPTIIVPIVLQIVASALQQPAALGTVDPQLGQVGVGVAQVLEGGAALRVRVLDAVQAGGAGSVRQIVPAGRLGRDDEEGRVAAVVGWAEQRQKSGGAGRSGLVRWSGARPLPALTLPPLGEVIRLSHVRLVRVKPDVCI